MPTRSLPSRVSSWARGHPLAVDALLAAALAAASVTDLGESTDEPLLGWLVLAGLVLPLVLRRRAPFAVFATIAAVSFGQWLVMEGTTANAAVLVALYTVVVAEPRRALVVAAVAAAQLGAVLAGLAADDTVALSIVALTAMVAATVATAVAIRARRAAAAAALGRAVAGERERIARELHDVVAHSLTVMVALADGARLTAGADPERADRAMEGVATTGRRSLAEMRRVIGYLREPDGTGPLAPQPGLADLDALLEDVRRAGLQAELTRAGTPLPLGPAAELTLFRVVQEALTNTLKHARGASRAEVTLAYDATGVAVEVVDDGASGAPGAAGQGHGLSGMRERIQAHGARLEAGPRPGGGWRVRTRLEAAA